ncbi:MAG: hypothetical protein RBR67_06110 [Desulfobacterium sp.]|nr:hypothetical protein [Desulfobacterium sp.]
MSISLNTAQRLINGRENFKMNELGDELSITIGQNNKIDITKAEIMEPPNRPKHKALRANTGFEGLFKATIDKVDSWRTTGKLNRAQDAIEMNLGRVAGKFVNLHTLAGKTDLDFSKEIAEEKGSLTNGIAKELSAFKTEIESLVRSYGLNSKKMETQFLQRLINNLKKDNPAALNRLKAAVEVMASVPGKANSVMRDHEALVKQLDAMLEANMDGVVLPPLDVRTIPQKLLDGFKDLFSTEEQRVKKDLNKKLDGLEELCNVCGPEMDEINFKLKELRNNITFDNTKTIGDFAVLQEKLGSIIGETIRRGQEIAQDAIKMDLPKLPGELTGDKYRPQLVSAEIANRDLSKLFIYKNTTLAQTKSLRSQLDEKVDDVITEAINDRNQSKKLPKGARAVVQIAVNSTKDMTGKFVKAQQELKNIEMEFCAIVLAKQLAVKGDTPPGGVDAKAWSDACSVMTEHLLKAPGSLISAKDVSALNLVKANAAQFTEGLEGDAVKRLGKLFTRLDVNTAFTVLLPKPTPEQIEQFKQTGEKFMQENAEQFGKHLEEWRKSVPDTGITELNNRLDKVRAAPLTLDPAKLSRKSLGNTLSDLQTQIETIKSAYSYEIASHLSGIDDKQVRLDRRTELLAALKTELQGLMPLEADLQSMINMRVMGGLASEGLAELRQSCPENEDRAAWESDCNTIVDFIMENPKDVPDEKTVAVFEDLLGKFNQSPSTKIKDEEKVKLHNNLYNNLKEDLNSWKEYGLIMGMGSDSLNSMEHMDDVLQGVSKMTIARIRISDMVNLMGDSFIALTKAGLPNSHADELRSNLSEYTHKLMLLADGISRTDQTITEQLSQMREEAQESLSKTMYSFFPAMEFLAGKEADYLDKPAKFTVDQTRQVTDLRKTLFHAYTAVFDIARNVGTLGLDDVQDVSYLLKGLSLEDEALESRENDALGEIVKTSKYAGMSHKVDPENPSSQTEVTASMMEQSKAGMNVLLYMNNEKQTTKLFTQMRGLATALVEAKTLGLDPAVARSIERLFSEHVLIPDKGLKLDDLIPDKQKHENFIAQFDGLHQAIMQTGSTIQSFKLNVKSTQTSINMKAENYLKGCVMPKSLRTNLRVRASHDIDGKMSRILIGRSSKEEPRWYDVSLSKDTLTFTPVDDKSGKGVLAAPASNGGVRFPNV